MSAFARWLFLLLLFAGLSSAITTTVLNLTTAGGKDTWLDNSTMYSNYGSSATWTIGQNDSTRLWYRQAIVAFNTTVAGAGGLNMSPYHVISANFSARFTSNTGSKNCSNLSITWTNVSRNWTETQASWVAATSAINWTVKGGDIGSGGGANVVHLIENTSFGFYNWSLEPTWLEYLRDVQTPAGNFTGMESVFTTMASQPKGGHNCSFNFDSANSLTVANRPYVSIIQNSPPNFTAYGVNVSNPIPGETVMINATVGDDEIPLGQFTTIFSWTGDGLCDGSTYSNDSLVVQMWLSMPKNVSTIKTIPSVCEGKPIKYKQYATDPRGDMNVSAEQTFLVQNVSPVVGNSFFNVSSTNRNTQVCANSSVTDVGVGVDKVFANLTFPNGTVVYRYYLTATPKGDCGGGGSIYSMFVSVGSTVGNVTVQNITANDTLGNVGTNTTQRNVSVLNAAPVFGGDLVVPSSPQNYSVSVEWNAVWSDDAGVNVSWIQLDGVNYSMARVGGDNLSGQYRATFANLAAGTHPYNYSASDGDGAWGFGAGGNYVINTGNPFCRMLLNGTEANRTYNISTSNNNTINATGFCIGWVSLFENTTLVNTSANWSQFFRNVTTEQNGTCFNYTVAVDLSQNYSASHATWWACVNDITPPPLPSAHGRARVFIQEDEDEHKWLWFVQNEQWPAVIVLVVVVLALLVGGAVYGRRKAS